MDNRLFILVALLVSGCADAPVYEYKSCSAVTLTRDKTKLALADVDPVAHPYAVECNAYVRRKSFCTWCFIAMVTE